MRKKPLIEWTARSALFGLFVLMTAALSVSCSDENETHLRSEYINVYPNPFREATSTTVVLSVAGGEQTVYVRSNIDFTAHWENSGTNQWATVIDDNGIDQRTGCRTITLDVDPISTSSILYTKRTGMLVFEPTDPSLNYNVFITCNQGSTQRLGTDFSWLSYGTSDANPQNLDGTLMEDWSTTQLNYNYSSTLISGEETVYCYGRRGYIQLGDNEGHGADLITPNTSSFYEDSLLVVSFNAVAYVATNGQKDGNKLTVEVQGGGVIQDYGGEYRTSIEFAVPYYDDGNDNFPSSMWDGTNYLVFVQGTEGSPLSASTKIRFISGSLSETGTENNRIFLDNLYIYTVGENEEDYFKENGGSGLDYILGGQ